MKGDGVIEWLVREHSLTTANAGPAMTSHRR
jgi:hypothetical protein